jgi:acetylornithine deacetylase/succinyl-diaminopimelate desuccinylase-like protein
MHPRLDAVAARADAGVEPALEQLIAYLAIPAISCKPERAADVVRLADRVCADLAALGLDRARVLTVEGALPIVAAEWLRAEPGRPTILIYGHLDLQPADEDDWDAPPHSPRRVGDRLFARGSADDMGGWVSHFAALKAWFDVAGGPPCNIKLIIEGEEEIGSPNLERYMDAFPDVFSSDVMVLTDCENPSTDTPGLTVSLRGLLELRLTCRALSADVHSGLWGGMVPDVSIALARLIARITDDDGRLTVGRVDVGAARAEKGRGVPLGNDDIRGGAHLLPGVDPLPVRDRSAAEWMWWQPCLTVVATTLPTMDRKKNALRKEASAILSIRVAPDQRGADLEALLTAELLRDPPGGVQVTVEQAGWHGDGWLYSPKGPAFEAADRAYQRAWGRPLVQVGVGGSIPFVALFGRRFGDLPLILNGVMDPLTTAHGPNESLHLGVFRKAVLANVYLLDELARL